MEEEKEKSSHLCFPKPDLEHKQSIRKESLRKVEAPLKKKKNFLQVWGEKKGPGSHTGMRKIIARVTEMDIVWRSNNYRS